MGDLHTILGRGRVEGVEIAHLDSGQTELIACDTVVFTGDWIPEHELARLGGLAVDPGTRGPRVDSGFRTSAQGVFAAGNLLHGAETADVSALEGRHAARRIHEFLSHGLWPARILPIQVDKPLAWVFPNAVSAANSQPPVASFTFRVHEFCTNARVLVCQGERTLHTQTFRRLQPNASMRLDSRWLGGVNVEGEALSLVLTR